MVRVAVDAMGGDDAPAAIVAGAAQASRDTGAHIVLVGDRPAIEAELAKVEHDPSRIEILEARGVIAMDAKPREALDAQPEASMPRAARCVAEGAADALVSAGNTGAVILSCARHFERIPGVRRTALAAVVPTEQLRGSKNDPFSLLLDVGANVRVEAADLVSFALMGAAYSRIISKNQDPKVALLSNGSEANKGPEEIVEAHARLLALDCLRFIGNVEGVDISRGTADVVVTDGFTGNVVLKMLEGVSETVMRIARHAYEDRLSWKIALGLLKGGIQQLKAVTDWQQYGGAPVLGFKHLCIKAHGRSGPRAIRNAIRVAETCVKNELVIKIQRDVESTQ